MKRRQLTIAIFLLAGAVMNVGVAWGCQIRMEEVLGTFILRQEALWKKYAQADWPPGPTGLVSVARAFGYELRISSGYVTGEGIRRGRGYMIGQVRAWWPMRSLLAEQWSTSNKSWGSAYRLGRFPARPIWPGFAVNTVLFAAILWLLIPGPFALRRLIRRRRGLCLACGYDLRHAKHEACPECGVTA